MSRAHAAWIEHAMNPPVLKVQVKKYLQDKEDLMTNGEDDRNCRGYRGQRRQTTQEGKMRKTMQNGIFMMQQERGHGSNQSKVNKSQVWVIHLRTPYRFVS